MADLRLGECNAVLRGLDSDSIDSLVTDPPAGISFMGKEWDTGKDFISVMTNIYSECLRVLKPGAHGLIWALPRTSHWTATALENAGFEVRDVVTHLFGTGFPKSLDVSKAIDKATGVEREIIGSKIKSDIRGSTVDGIWIGLNKPEKERIEINYTAPSSEEAKQWEGWGTALKPASEHWVLVRKPLGEKTVAANVLKHGVGGINIDQSRIKPNDAKSGRFPANLILDEEAAAMLDEQVGLTSTGGKPVNPNPKKSMFGISANSSYYNDGRNASRFFYVAKASKSDRGEGNHHPTVKSAKLMSYLIKLITPPGGLVLDPFMGSGSTGVAAKAEGFEFVGIEQSAEYFEIARRRIDG